AMTGKRLKNQGQRLDHSWRVKCRANFQVSIRAYNNGNVSLLFGQSQAFDNCNRNTLIAFSDV
ncbi:MAG: hypothetical protein QGI86_28050, partial [Candidatus Poribacteria bacterium]|nr:hypothetical protein [Candidatus Poribacteria bacterium]